MQTNLPTRQVFIVDDSAGIRSRLAEMLGRIHGVRVVGEASNAPQAVADILAILPDFVLLDLDLGGTSGMQVLRAIHPRAPGIVFVVLTNHSEPQYRTACQRAGAKYFLDKSTQFDQVRQLIAQAAPAH